MLSEKEKRLVLPIFTIAGVAILFFIGGRMWTPVNAGGQLQSNIESDIVVVPVQIERDSFGVVLVDKVGQTMCVYELNRHGPAQNRLKLLAARSWKHDRLLQQYNTAKPSPLQVKKLLEDLAEQQKEQNKETRKSGEINISNTAKPNGSN